MGKTYRAYLPEQKLLLPPSLQDWLPDNHLVYFVSDVVDQLDLSAIEKVYERGGVRGGVRGGGVRDWEFGWEFGDGGEGSSGSPGSSGEFGDRGVRGRSPNSGSEPLNLPCDNSVENATGGPCGGGGRSAPHHPTG